jgi:hypothetical protein
VWEAWLALENRWRTVTVEKRRRGMVIGSERRLEGLDAVQVESTLRLMGMKRKERSRVFAGLRAMEKAALAALYGNGET